jgi:hypothetical protein
LIRNRQKDQIKMENKSKTKTQVVLNIMLVLTWIAFIGLLIKTGAMLFSYLMTLIHPEKAKDMYSGLNLYNLMQFNFWNYSQIVSFMIIQAVLKAYILFLLIKMLSNVKLSNPFTKEVASQLESLSFISLGIWIISIIGKAHSSWLMKRAGVFQTEFESGEFLFMAGLVFIISQVFKRGVELQSENELTV